MKKLSVALRYEISGRMTGCTTDSQPREIFSVSQDFTMSGYNFGCQNWGWVEAGGAVKFPRILRVAPHNS